MRDKSMLADLRDLLRQKHLTNAEVERLIERTMSVSEGLADHGGHDWKIIRAGVLAIISDLGIRRPDLLPLVKAQLSGWIHRQDDAAFAPDRLASKNGPIAYRAHPRIRVKALYTVLRRGAEADYFAPVQDFSRSGAKILSRLAMAKADRVQVGQVEANVVRLVPGGFACHFIDELRCLDADWTRG